MRRIGQGIVFFGAIAVVTAYAAMPELGAWQWFVLLVWWLAGAVSLADLTDNESSRKRGLRGV